MKKILEKSIAIVAMVAFVAISANAQRVVKNVDAFNAQACGAYLSENPADTILNVYNIEKRGRQGVVTRRVFFVGSTTLRGDNDTVWSVERQIIDEALLKVLDRQSAESLAADHPYRNPNRDYEYLSSSELEDYSRTHGVTHEDAGKIIEKASDNQGFAATIDGGISVAEEDGSISPLFRAGMSYSFLDLGRVSLAGKAERLPYSSLLHEGKYWSYGYEALLGVKLFKIDSQKRRVHHRLYLEGGISQMWQKVGDEILARPGEDGFDIIDSAGSNLAWVAGLSYQFDPWFSTVNWGFSIRYVRNFGGQLNASSRQYGRIEATLSLELEMFRNKVSLKD